MTCKGTLLKRNVALAGTAMLLLVEVLAGSSLATAASPQSTTPLGKPGVASTPTRYLPNRYPRRATEYYELVWGVDTLRVKAVESGELIRFTYHVVDPEKAKALNNKEFEPELIAPDAQVKLVVPSLEKVGQLRQSATPEEGRSYWMAFSNPRRTVKPGDRVNVVIGHFHADGLVVE